MDNNTTTPNEPVIPTPAPAQGPSMPQPEQPPVGQPLVSSPGMPALPADAKAKKSALIETIVLIVVCLIAAAAIVFAVVFFIQKNEAETNIEGKINAEVALAVEEQRSIDESNFAEREKLPNSEFVGPSDYGSLSFMYPKTWSIYVAKDASNGGDFEAYFNPIQVNPASENTINALRVYIYDRPIDQVRTTYDSLVKSGKLTSSVYTVGDITGTKYEGAFNNNITGIALMIKINDKTAVIRTDAEIFRTDFEALIATIRKN
ncbi:MAG: hypothetical protein ACK5MU_02960 [Candidatus Saccharimonadales bacterium]